jgi:hypothetical protein
MLESPCSPPPSSSSSPHHQQFLFHLMRMRHFQTAVSDPLLLPSRPYLPEGSNGHLQFAKRPLPVHLDQPLDFSAKKSRMDSSPSPAGWFHQRSSSGEENREFSAAAAEAFISVAAAAAVANAAADINKHDSLGSDGHSDLSTSHSPQSNGSPRQEDLLYGHHSGPPGGQSLRLHPRAAANPEEEDNEDGERENSRSPPRLAIPSPSPSPPEADPHQLSRHHHHNGLLTTVASLAQPSLPLLRAPIGGNLSADPHTPPPPGEYKPALLGLPLPYFGGTSAAANKMGNPYALSLAIGSPANGGYRPSHHHGVHDSSPPRSVSSGGGGGGGGPESMSELTKIAVTSNQKYAEFRENMLRNMENGRSVKNTKKAAAGDLNRSYSPATSGSSVTTSTPTAESHMLLAAQRQSSSEERSGGENKDEAYWERRRKNNEAAKRSRDARRQKENEIAVRASFLEQENIQLKLELVQLRTELGSLRQQVHQQVRAN